MKNSLSAVVLLACGLLFAGFFAPLAVRATDDDDAGVKRARKTVKMLDDIYKQRSY